MEFISFYVTFLLKSHNYLSLNNENYSADFTDLRNKANQINNIECKDDIFAMIDESENLFFDENMTVNEINDIIINNSIITKFLNTTKSCNISEEKQEEYNMVSKTTSVAMIYEDLINKYRSNYKLVIDYSAYDIDTYPSIITAELIATKTAEIERINNIIEVVLNEE